jgi:hypothetical protein
MHRCFLQAAIHALNRELRHSIELNAVVLIALRCGGKRTMICFSTMVLRPLFSGNTAHPVNDSAGRFTFVDGNPNKIMCLVSDSLLTHPRRNFVHLSAASLQ